MATCVVPWREFHSIASCLKWVFHDRVARPLTFLTFVTLQIRNKASPHCIDHASDYGSFNTPIEMSTCHNLGGNQYWLLSSAGEIRRDMDCVEYTRSGKVTMYKCHGFGGNQKWRYKEVIAYVCLHV